MKIFRKCVNSIIDLCEDTIAVLDDNKNVKRKGYINTKQFYKDCTGVFSCMSLNMISSFKYRLCVFTTVSLIFFNTLFCAISDNYPILCLNIFLLTYWAVICARYTRMKKVIPAIWYFKALNEEYDKNNVLFDIFFKSGAIYNIDLNTDDNITGSIIDYLCYFYWRSARETQANNLSQQTEYVKWKDKYFSIGYFIEVPSSIIQIIIIKSIIKYSDAIKDEKVITYFDKLDDDSLSKLLIDTYHSMKEYGYDSLFRSILIEMAKDDIYKEIFDNEPHNTLTYIKELINKEGYEINVNTFEISRIPASESSRS